MRRVSTALILLALVGWPVVARAQQDMVGPRALGAGEAQRTTGTGATALFLNPAGMSLVRGYVIEGIYGFTVEDLGHRAHISVVDSITARVAAGLFYTFIHTNPKIGIINWAGGQLMSPAITRTGHAAGLSVSIPLGRYFILGATAKYLHFDTTAALPAGTVPPNLTLDHVNGVTFDVGALVRLGERFRIAVVGQNLWDHGSRESPLTLGIGLGVIPIPALAITFDTAINFTGYQNFRIDPAEGNRVILDARVAARLGPGIEWTIAGKVPIRAGVVYDSGQPGTFITAGLGYVSPQFGIDLGYRGKVQGGVENTLLLGIRLFVN